MKLQPALARKERGEEPDGSRAGDEHTARLPYRASADPLRMLPRFGDDARRLEQHAELAERGLDLHCECGVDAPPLGAESIQLLDAMLLVATVATHIPFAGGAVHAGHRIGLTDDADDQVALDEPTARRRVFHATQ